MKANGVPFVYLMTIPTWHTRMSSWSFFIKLPEFIVNRLNSQEMRDGLIVNVMVIDDCVKVTAGMGSLNKTVDTYYDPNLIDLTMSLLLKVKLKLYIYYLNCLFTVNIWLFQLTDSFSCDPMAP